MKFETSAERRDVANKTLPNQRTFVGDHESRGRNTGAGYSSSVHHMITVRTDILMNNRLDRRQKLKSHIPKLYCGKRSIRLNCRQRLLQPRLRPLTDGPAINETGPTKSCRVSRASPSPRISAYSAARRRRDCDALPLPLLEQALNQSLPSAVVSDGSCKSMVDMPIEVAEIRPHAACASHGRADKSDRLAQARSRTRSNIERDPRLASRSPERAAALVRLSSSLQPFEHGFDL